MEPKALTWWDAIDKLPQIETWQDWGEIFLDVPTWAPVVTEICRRAGLPCRTITAGYPGSNAVFIANASDPEARVVVKIYAPLCPEDYDFEREIHPLLSQIPELGAPRLIAHGVLASQTRWPYVVLSFVPGEPIREVRDEISDGNLMQIAADLGHRVRALHAIPPAMVTSLDATIDGWRRYVAQQVPRTIKALRRESDLPNRLLAQIPAFVDDVLAPSPRGGATSLQRELVLVSGDITADHVLLIVKDGAWCISGLIDFADARVAPPDYEWVPLWFSAFDRDAAAFDAFLRAYDPALCLDAAFYRRALAFTFLHEFGASIIAQTLPPRVQHKLEDVEDLLAALWQQA
ncbi:MAG: aminoglycoside phosphotransferase family protein [Anaerolineae bacterium]|nr:aminoglycoside phosphotransferase family protein [Anaerolineae bacterium]